MSLLLGCSCWAGQIIGGWSKGKKPREEEECEGGESRPLLRLGGRGREREDEVVLRRCVGGFWRGGGWEGVGEVEVKVGGEGEGGVIVMFVLSDVIWDSFVGKKKRKKKKEKRKKKKEKRKKKKEKRNAKKRKIAILANHKTI